MNSFKISKMLFILFVALVFTVSGCQEKENLNVESVKDSQTIIEPTHEIHPWENERYHYEYLEGKVNEANQYLKENSLNFEDLKQIHDLVNVLFGEYRDALTFHFDERTPDLMDPTLFDSKYSMYDLYQALILDYQNIEDGKENPYIRILTRNIGERHGYLFVPIRVYRTRNPKIWDYVVLALKKNKTSKYGFVYCMSTQYLQMTVDRNPNSPWFASLNDEDNFSESSWLVFFDDEDFQMFDYYLGNTKICPNDSLRCGLGYSKAGYVQKYDRQAAAGYSYDHAYNYNNQYYSWKSSQQDCANFASQCLAAGGLPQDEYWQYYDRGFTSGTSAWRGAQNLLNYLINKNGKYPYTRAEKVRSQYVSDTYYQKTGSWCSLRWGDLIFITQSGKMNFNNPVTDHVYVITHSFNDVSPYYNGTPRWTVSAHTSDVQDNDIINEMGKRFLENSTIGVHILY